MITIYETPGCVQCRMTKHWLDRAGAEYQTVDLSESPQDMAAVKALGYQSAPVVAVGDEHWSGFQPARLLAAVNRPAGEVA